VCKSNTITNIIKFSDSDLLQLQLDKSDINESLLSNGAGNSNDLIIILKT